MCGVATLVRHASRWVSAFEWVVGAAFTFAVCSVCAFFLLSLLLHVDCFGYPEHGGPFFQVVEHFQRLMLMELFVALVFLEADVHVCWFLVRLVSHRYCLEVVEDSRLQAAVRRLCVSVFGWTQSRDTNFRAAF